MSESELPADVQVFLREHIESYEQLELLLIVRADRESRWTEGSLGTRLRLSPSPVRAALDRLAAAGFVERQAHSGEDSYAYVCQSEETEATIAQLAASYREYPIPIIKLMSANAIERLRTAALRTFSDAFVLRKGKDRG